MASEFSRKFYSSPAWRKCRKGFISQRVAIDGGICQHCQSELGYIVDHVEELTPENINNPNITLSWSNLQYLCLSCHNSKTFGTDNKYYFDEDGMIQERTPPVEQEDLQD